MFKKLTGGNLAFAVHQQSACAVPIAGPTSNFYAVFGELYQSLNHESIIKGGTCIPSPIELSAQAKGPLQELSPIIPVLLTAKAQERVALRGAKYRIQECQTISFAHRH